MTWLNKLERKFGKYAIANLTLYLIICYGFGYVLQIMDFGSNSNFMDYLSLNPYAIVHGQVWRIFTWIIVPPSSLDLFTLITLYFYYSIGRTLERTWGTFRYNVYIFSGLLFTVIGSLVFLGLAYALAGADINLIAQAYGMADVNSFFAFCSTNFSTYHVCMSIFLAFAATFPDMQVLLMFVIPLKVKVMGIIYAIILGYEFLTSFVAFLTMPNNVAGMVNLAISMGILSSFLSFLIFFITTRRSFRTPTQLKRQHEYKKKVVVAQKIVSKHKCAICGQSQESNPDLEFRFCSKCNGNYEYCQEHLFTHEHVK